MQVNGVSYNTPNFQARLRINKLGLQNLAKDLLGTTEIGSRASASGSSAVAESTVFPAELASEGKSLLPLINSNKGAISKEAKAISARDVKSSTLENTEDLQKLAESTGIASAGASSTASGVGADVASMASAFDQSAHYPNSSYPASVYDSVINHSPESVATSVENITQRAYDSLWDPQGCAGNECASITSSFTSTSGNISNYTGSCLLKDGKAGLNKFVEDANTNIPS